MKMQKSALVAVAAVAVVTFGVSAQSADARKGADDINEHAAISTVGVTVTRDQAIATAKARLDGTVKKAQLEREHGKKTWQVRILSTDGLKRGDFRIDATSGDILREKIKDIGSKKLERAQKLAEKMEKKKLKLEAKKLKLEEKAKKKAAKRAEREARKSDDSRSDD